MCFISFSQPLAGFVTLNLINNPRNSNFLCLLPGFYHSAPEKQWGISIRNIPRPFPCRFRSTPAVVDPESCLINVLTHADGPSHGFSLYLAGHLPISFICLLDQQSETDDLGPEKNFFNNERQIANNDFSPYLFKPNQISEICLYTLCVCDFWPRCI